VNLPNRASRQNIMTRTAATLRNNLLLFGAELALATTSSAASNPAACDVASLTVVAPSTGGGLELGLCGDTFSVRSQFSYPGMMNTGGAWNTFGGSGGAPSWSVTTKGGGLAWTTVGTHPGVYSVERTIKPAPTGRPRLLIEDTITNLQPVPLGLAFQNQISVVLGPGQQRQGCAPKLWSKHYTNVLSPCIHVAGLRGEQGIANSNSYTATNVAWNPTVLLEGQAGSGSLGLAVLDERWRLQLDMSDAANFTARLDNRGLGLPPAGSHTYRWAIYPVPAREMTQNGTGGYWEFINRLRSDYVPATTLRKLGGWLDYLRATQWSKERLTQWLSVRGFKHVIIGGPYGGEPWLGETTNWTWYPSATKGVPVNATTMLQMLSRTCSLLRDIDPEIQCSPAFETAMSPGLYVFASTRYFVRVSHTHALFAGHLGISESSGRTRSASSLTVTQLATVGRAVRAQWIPRQRARTGSERTATNICTIQLPAQQTRTSHSCSGSSSWRTPWQISPQVT
jgi:hypothetical protein